MIRKHFKGRMERKEWKTTKKSAHLTLIWVLCCAWFDIDVLLSVHWEFWFDFDVEKIPPSGGDDDDDCIVLCIIDTINRFVDADVCIVN